MRRNRVEVMAQRGELLGSDHVFVYDGHNGLFQMTLLGFQKTFGFTPRPGKKIKIVMEIQEEKK